MIVSPTSRNDGIVNSAGGSFTGDGTAVTIMLGFTAGHVIVFNETDAMRWEKLGAEAAANSIKTVTGGTQTCDTSSAVVINSDGTVTLSAALAASGKVIAYVARV